MTPAHQNMIPGGPKKAIILVKNKDYGLFHVQTEPISSSTILPEWGYHLGYRVKSNQGKNHGWGIGAKLTDKAVKAFVAKGVLSVHKATGWGPGIAI